MIRVYCFQNTKKENRNERVRNTVRAYTDELGMSFCDEKDWILEKDRKGKPYFPGHPETFVSITDSRDYWMIAFADFPVGIDLQKRQIRGSQVNLAKRFFHPAETEWILEPSDEKERDFRFFRVWAAKEAYVKFTGQGIDSAFSDFSVISAGKSDEEIFRSPGLGVSFCFHEDFDGFAFCICVPLETEREKEAAGRDIFQEVAVC